MHVICNLRRLLIHVCVCFLCILARSKHAVIFGLFFLGAFKMLKVWNVQYSALTKRKIKMHIWPKCHENTHAIGLFVPWDPMVYEASYPWLPTKFGDYTSIDSIGWICTIMYPSCNPHSWVRSKPNRGLRWFEYFYPQRQNSLTMFNQPAMAWQFLIWTWTNTWNRCKKDWVCTACGGCINSTWQVPGKSGKLRWQIPRNFHEVYSVLPRA